MNWLLAYADPSLDWSYAMITLLVRFIGVFVVMLVMQGAMQVAARAVRFVERDRSGASVKSTPSDVEALANLESSPLDDGTLAAIGVALALESGTRLRPAPDTQTTSTWRAAARIAQMRRAVR